MLDLPKAYKCLQCSALSMLLLLTAGCLGTKPTNSTPVIVTPNNWQTEYEIQKPDGKFTFPASDFSGTPVLALVKEALEKSPFLESSQALADAAGAQLEMIKGNRRPQLNGQFRSTRQKHNFATSAAFGRHFGGSTFITNHYAADLVSSWELDLWGRLRDLENAASADFESALQDFESARLSIAAKTTSAYIKLLSTSLAKTLVEETVGSYRDNLDIIQNRYEDGLASALDLRLTQASLTSSRAKFERHEREEQEAKRALEVLLGRYPSAGFSSENTLPKVVSPIPAGLPSELISRRPDIRAAQKRLLAAGFRANEARKNYLPRLSLTGTNGTASQNLRDLNDTSFSAWNLVGNLTQPLLDGGRIKAQRKYTSALRKKAAADYKNIVLKAFKEVEDALDAEARLAREEASLEQAALEYSDAETLAWDRYRKGLTDILTALEAQRRSNEARILHLSLRSQRIINRIQLHLALATPLTLESPTL